jgi:hypothetical protein
MLRLRLRSLLYGGGMVSAGTAAAILSLQQKHIGVRGPFVTPARQRLFLINESLITEDELLALQQTAELQPEILASRLIDLKRTQSPSFARQRRSQRILLKLPLLVEAEMPDGVGRRTEVSTVIVNAHGGLLESQIRMAVDQRILLINPQSGKRVGGRVVSVQELSEHSVRAAFEFEQHSPSFWPLAFPPLDWAIGTAIPHPSNA